MKNSVLLLLLLSCLLSGFGLSSALAFGPVGHKVIAINAQSYLSPVAAAKVKAILATESLADASVWPDVMRGSSSNKAFWKHTGKWHYVNVPKGQNYNNAQHEPKGDIIVAIVAFSAVLADQPIKSHTVKAALRSYFGDLNAAKNKAELKQFALRFLIHFIGDLHQPLHSGYKADRGGNRIIVNWFNEKQNLHRVWDSLLIAKQNLTTKTLAKKLNPVASADKSNYQRGTILDWLNEALVMREVVYDVGRYNKKLGQGYVNEHTAMINQQMQKAAVRAAHLLNQILK